MLLKTVRFLPLFESVLDSLRCGFGVNFNIGLDWILCDTCLDPGWMG